MALTSINIASKGHLDRGDKPTLNEASDGLLRDDGGVPPEPTGSTDWYVSQSPRRRR